MRKISALLLSLVMALSLSAAAVVLAGAESSPVDFAADETKWEVKQGVAFDDQGLYLTNANPLFSSVEIGGNATIELTAVGTIEHQWSYQWLIIKNTNGVPVEWKGQDLTKSSEGSGDFIALVYGASTNAYIAECNDGVITKTQLSWDGKDTWYNDACTTDITVVTKDTDEGVEVNITFKATGGSATEAVNTYTVKSTNKALWGRQRFAWGATLGGTVNGTEATIRFGKINVTEEDSGKGGLVDYTSDESLIAAKSNVELAGDHAYATAATYSITTKPVGGNSKFTVTNDFKVSDAQWSYDYICFKGSDDFAITDWTSAPKKATGSGLAIAAGPSCANLYIIEVKDGVITENQMGVQDTTFTQTQKTIITVKTTDTETGVTVSVVYTAVNTIRDTNLATGESHSVTYNSTNIGLWGEYSITAGRIGDGTFSAENNSINIEVKDIPASDLSITPEVKEQIEGLPEEVNKENYVEVSGKIRQAKEMFDMLTPEQQAAIDNSAKLTAAVEALEAFESENAAFVEAAVAVEALPENVTRRNYKEAKAAVEEAGEKYEALGEDDKAVLGEKYNAAKAALEAFEAAHPDPVADEDNLAQSKANWSTLGSVAMNAVSFGLEGAAIDMESSNATGILLKKNVVANSKLSFKIDGRMFGEEWGQLVIMFKSKDANPNALAPLAATGYSGMAAAPQGTWMGLMMGNSIDTFMQVSECVDGTVKATKKEELCKEISNNDLSAVRMGVTELTIEITDTDEGVNVKFTIKVTEAEIASGNEYTFEYATTEQAFKGDYAVSFGMYGGQKAEVPDEKVVLSSFKAEALGGGKALIVRSGDGLFNHATSKDYWKDIAPTDKTFEFDQNGITLYDNDKAGFLLNRKIQDGETVTYEFDNYYAPESLPANPWGNLYIVLRNKRPDLVYAKSDSGLDPVLLPGDNMIVVVISAGDYGGFGMLDIRDGKIYETREKLHAEDNTDMWYWYRQSLKVSITVTDTEDGVRVEIVALGASGKTTVSTQTVDNPALHGEGYTSVEYKVGMKSEGNVVLATAKVSGVTEGYVSDADIDAENVKLESARNTPITKDNIEEMEAVYQASAAVYEELNYSQRKLFAIDHLNALKANIEAYYEDIAEAEEVNALIAALPETVGEENYAEAKTAIEAAKRAYEALGPSAKLLVEGKEKLDGAVEALASYEAALAVDALIDEIPAEINEENHDAYAAAVEAAEEAYNALTDTQKALVKGGEILTAARAALDGYRPSQTADCNSCNGGIGACGIFSALGLVAAALIKRRRA